MELEQKVKRFTKLGYSPSDIVRVLQSLQHDAQTNDILQELIKTCPGTNTRVTRTTESSPKLVPRGCGSPPQQQQQSDLITDTNSPFRPVVIDGSNVAISHGNKKTFSCRGIQLAVQWFWDQGIRDITVFVPSWRKEHSRPEAPITDQHILNELERRNILVYTPSRCVNGKRVVCYDDRFIVKLAYDSDGIIVSNDNYRDLQVEKPQWKKFIEERLLMYTFANDIFMPPDDPLGRNGPTIDNFLRKKPLIHETKQQHCPYGKKCTYGIKCKFYHPERTNQPQLSVADELRAQSQPPSEAEDYNNHPHHTRVMNGPPEHKLTALKYPDELTRTLSSLDLYSSPHETQSSTHFQGSIHDSCRSTRSDQAYGSLEGSMSRLYLSDPALPTSLGYSSGRMAGSDNDYFLSASSCMEHRRARTPDFPPRCYSPNLHYSNALCPEHRYPQHIPNIMCSEPRPYSPSRQQAAYGIPYVSWENLTDRRQDVRSQLSTIFPQRIVDQVMGLYPDILDTTKLVLLIHRYRSNSLL